MDRAWPLDSTLCAYCIPSVQCQCSPAPRAPPVCSVQLEKGSQARTLARGCGPRPWEYADGERGRTGRRMLCTTSVYCASSMKPSSGEKPLPHARTAPITRCTSGDALGVTTQWPTRRGQAGTNCRKTACAPATRAPDTQQLHVTGVAVAELQRLCARGLGGLALALRQHQVHKLVAVRRLQLLLRLHGRRRAAPQPRLGDGSCHCVFNDVYRPAVSFTSARQQLVLSMLLRTAFYSKCRAMCFDVLQFIRRHTRF